MTNPPLFSAPKPSQPTPSASVPSSGSSSSYPTPNVYYSPVPGWRPSNDPTATVIYITPSPDAWSKTNTPGGITTGQVSGGNINVPSGIDVTGTTQTGTNVGSAIATQIKNQPVQSSLNNQIQSAISSGDIQVYSGRLLSNQQMAKASLLSAVNKTPMPEQYGTYYKGTTIYGTNLLNQYQRESAMQSAVNQGGQSISSSNNLDYNTEVKNAYQTQLSKSNVQSKFFLSDFYKSGTYYPATDTININPIFPFKGSTISHEIGHQLDFGEKVSSRNYLKYKESSSNLTPDLIENLGYSKDKVGYEYYARAFSNYISNPSSFKQKYPEIASEFESRLNIGSTKVNQGSSVLKNYLSQTLSKPYEQVTISSGQTFDTNYLKNHPGSYQSLEGGGGTASPITASDITLLASGVGGIYKGGLLIGSEILFSKPITEVTSGGIDYLIPRQDSGFAKQGFLPQVGRGGLFLLSTPVTGTAFAYQFGKSLIESPAETGKSFIEFGKKNPYEIATVILGARPVEKITDISLFGKKAYKIEPTPEMESSVQPFTRQSARLFLTDKKGNYILGKSGSEYISIGGGIEKGQTPKTAVLAELKQETGLSRNDITNFQSRGKVVYPEETMNIFTAKINDVSKIKPSSDINKIKTFNPDSIFLKGATGQTGFQPISRFTLGGKVRAYEAGVINYLETGKKPTWLGIDTKQGTFILGTQSRYNVPFSSQKQFLNQESLLAHGTASPSIMRRFFPFEKSDVVKGELTRRGQAEGLYVQPPISTAKGSSGYIGLSYLGFKTSQAVDYLGTKIGKQKSTTYLFKERVGGEIRVTPKTLSGAEEEFIINPGTKIGSKGRAEVFSIGFKRVYAQPSRIIREGETPLISSSKTIQSISEEGNYRYISPRELTSPISVSQISKSRSSISSQSSRVSSIVSNISKSNSSIISNTSLTSSISKPSSRTSISSTSSNLRSNTPSSSIMSSLSKSISYPSKSYQSKSSSKYKFNEPTKTNTNPFNYPQQNKVKLFKRKKGISQPIAYTPSLGSSVFNIKLSNQKDIKSGKVSVFRRRGTLGIKELRKINQGSSIF